MPAFSCGAGVRWWSWVHYWKWYYGPTMAVPAQSLSWRWIVFFSPTSHHWWASGSHWPSRCQAGWSYCWAPSGRCTGWSVAYHRRLGWPSGPTPRSACRNAWWSSYRHVWTLPSTCWWAQICISKGHPCRSRMCLQDMGWLSSTRHHSFPSSGTAPGIPASRWDTRHCGIQQPYDSSAEFWHAIIEENNLAQCWSRSSNCSRCLSYPENQSIWVVARHWAVWVVRPWHQSHL